MGLRHRRRADVSVAEYSRAHHDLHVVEHAGALLIDFTIPDRTTDGVTIKTIRAVELRVGEKVVPVDKNQPGPVHVKLPVEGLVGSEEVVRVRLTGAKGHPSDWSNAVTLTVLPPLANPSELKAQATPDGVNADMVRAGRKSFSRLPAF